MYAKRDLLLKDVIEMMIDPAEQACNLLRLSGQDQSRGGGGGGAGAGARGGGGGVGEEIY